ncbi:Cc-nbs-lrr resistance protein [Corchorus olitorius]|uniref:Cc-nbs-lrr resistance protein n=1 Tax=Corchorus olitorius TaxID=93759 RepID=A0A1R3GY32_9ROSI|nr:Cc-nbs-lrr resistance protein [Corchorus olitorius]
MASSLAQLQKLEIKRCNNLGAVVMEEEETTTTDDKVIIFPLLKSMIIEDCPNLTSFYWGISSPSLIEFSRDGDKLAATIGDGTESANGDIHILPPFFCHKCERLLNVFPLDMVGRLEKLEELRIHNCDSLEEIFEAQCCSTIESHVSESSVSFVFPKLTYLGLSMLPKLKCFYSRKHTTEWPSLKKIWVYGCDNLETFASDQSLNLGDSTNIPQPLFWVNEATFPNLEELELKWNDIMKEIWHGQLEAKFFCKLKVVKLIKFIPQSHALPHCFFQSLPNLEKLVVNDAPFNPIFQCEGYKSETLQLSELMLSKLPELTHIWKEDYCESFCNLRSVEVRGCGKLKKLMPSSMLFASLTTLEVSGCDGLMNLISCSTAKSLTQLTKMIVTDCKMIVEIIACQGDNEVKGGNIVFSRLSFLKLSCLLNLKGFCSGDHINIEFPALDNLIVNGCPRMEIFCQGELSTPKLQQVQLADEENMQWEGNLTIKQMFEEKVGYSGLKHLKFSEFLVLLNIWNRNPQEIWRFKNLEHLEVCDSNDLKCIFNLAIASSLCRLQQLEIKRCNNLEVVIEEEEATTTRDDKTIIFPLLKSIIVEACPDLRSFYGGRASPVEFPSLAKFEVSHCPNMTTFISAFSRDEDKLATIGDATEGNNDLITSFFCYEVVFPELEKMTISHLRNLRRIWYDQLHMDSFCKLKVLKVEYCDQLLNIFPSPILRAFQRLETLQVTDCGSLEQVFEIKETCVIATIQMQLKNLTLYRLPKLEHVWNFMDSHANTSISFQSLQDVDVEECWSLKSVFPFSIAKSSLQHLQSLDVMESGVEQIIVSKNSEGSEEESTRFEFNRLSLLSLWNLPDLKCFYPGTHTTTWPSLKKLWKWVCEKKIKIFGELNDAKSQIQQR